MKKLKNIFTVVALVAAMITMNSCGTVFGGKISACQKQKPAPGQPTRQVRIGALVGDCLTGLLWLAIDFADGAIYKPCTTTKASSSTQKIETASNLKTK